MFRVAVIALLLALSGCSDKRPLQPLFDDATAMTGLDFWHFSGATGGYYLPETIGSGLALLDYDSDGDLDIFFLQGSPLGTGATISDATRSVPPDWRPGNRLFRNEFTPTGDLSFTDVSAGAGDLGSGYSMGVAVGDYDNDGDPDLYVTGLEQNFLLQNDNGRFTDVTSERSVNDPRWNVSAAFLDADNDTDLDLFVTAYVGDPMEVKECYSPTGARDYCVPTVFAPLADRLFENRGDAGFVDITGQSGISAATGNGLGVITGDFNVDGLVDVYVANDKTANHLWINQGGGKFIEGALLAGAAYNSDGRAEASMGVTADDYDLDGDLDLFMTHLGSESNTLFENDGQGNFYDVTDRLNLAAGSMRYTGWGTRWIDPDHDGDRDLFVANGAVLSGTGAGGHPYAQRNQLFIAQDSRYEEHAFPGEPQNSRGVAFGDIDNDGDIDIVISNSDGRAGLYLNQPDPDRGWLMARLVGTQSHRDAAGARVALLRDGAPTLWSRVARDGSYGSASDPRVHFGLGDWESAVDIAVIWPNGSGEIWRDVAIRRIVDLVEGEGEPWQGKVR